MGTHSPAEVKPSRAQVRLFQRGALIAFAAVDRVDSNGLRVRLSASGLTLGTHLEVELLPRSRGRVAAMVAQHVSHGIGLVFEWIHRHRRMRLHGVCCCPQSILGGQDKDDRCS